MTWSGQSALAVMAVVQLPAWALRLL